MKKNLHTKKISFSKPDFNKLTYIYIKLITRPLEQSWLYGKEPRGSLWTARDRALVTTAFYSFRKREAKP